VPDAQTPLRSDYRVKTIETAKKHDEPKRVESSQALKATGSSSGKLSSVTCPHRPHALTSYPDTYTESELMRCSLWCLQKFSGTLFVYVGLRDAAMLLFSTTTAVRGGSSRILRWSDLFVSQIPMDDVCLGKRVPVSCEAGHVCSCAQTNALSLYIGACSSRRQCQTQPTRTG
jgi:hypothetical protein